MDKAQRLADVWKWSALIGTLLFAGFISIFSIVPYWNQPGSMIKEIVSSNLNFNLFIVILFLYGGHNIYSKKFKKSESEFHSLRCEVIRRGEEIWPGEQWNNRHETFQELDDVYGINLYHEN